MGSTRLPGKVLAPVAGRPMLAFQLARLQVGWTGPIVVATSTEERDDPIVEVAEAAGVGVVRGPEADVLGRYLVALATHDADHVVRLTADCPLTDPGLVVLDEPSSRLDPVTEQRLERALERLLRGRTAVIIAHRLETVERVDAVAVMGDGRLIEHGPRAALAADPTSRYARLRRVALGPTVADGASGDEDLLQELA